MTNIHPNSAQSHREHEDSGMGRSYRQQIVKLLAERNVPMTDRQVINALGVTDVNNVRPEITRLKQAGDLMELDKVVCEFTKKKVRTVCLRGH